MIREFGDVGIHLFRHGESFYRQGAVPMAEADDLTEAGVHKVMLSSEILSSYIKDRGSHLSVIASSPLGRTLQTAKIMTEVFGHQGIPLRKRLDSSVHGILILSRLQDQVGYDFRKIRALVEGGDFEYEGYQFFIDKSETNPQNISITEFSPDKIENIPNEVLAKFPEGFLNAIKSVETLENCQQRILKVIERILMSQGTGQFSELVLVSHDALTRLLVQRFTEGRKLNLEPGEFISMIKNGDNLNTKIGNLDGVYSFSKDFLSFFRTQS